MVIQMPENGQLYRRGIHRAATFWCTNRWDPDNPLPRIRAALYFVSFITIASFIMLSLFVGSVTMGMSEDLDASITNQIEAFTEEGDTSKETETPSGQNAVDTLNQEDSEARAKVVSSSYGTINGYYNDLWISISSGFEFLLYMKECIQAPDDFPQIQDLTASASNFEFDLLDEWERMQSIINSNPYEEGFRKYYYDLTIRARKIETSGWFNNSITFTICIAGILVGLSVHDEFSEDKLIWLRVLNLVVLIIFIVEICVKIVARGFTWWRFFGSGWNNFDFTIVFLAICIQDGGAIPMLRLLRLFRVLKVLEHFPQLAVIVNAVFHGLGSVACVLVLLAFSTFIFAVYGIILFRDNDPWHFESLHVAMFTLFRCATLEDWSDVMYINMLGCDKWGYGDFPARCINPVPKPLVSVFFFFVYIVFTGFIVLTLFIAVVTTGMTEAHENMSNFLMKQRQANEIVKALSITHEELDLYSKIFDSIDTNHNGELSETEILEAMQIDPDNEAHNIMAPLIKRSMDLICECPYVDFGCFMHIMATRRDIFEESQSNSVSAIASPSEESGKIGTEIQLAGKNSSPISTPITEIAIAGKMQSSGSSANEEERKRRTELLILKKSSAKIFPS